MTLRLDVENNLPVNPSRPQEDPVRKRCRVEIVDPNSAPWEKIKEDVLAIERAQFGDKAYGEEPFIRALENPNAVFVVIRDTENGRVVGFTYTLPAEDSYDDEFYPERLEEIRSLDGRVAYIEDTVLLPGYTGHHLVGPLMGTLETELVQKGYKYIDRDAASANNYAGNIRKTYSTRILMNYPHDSKYGPQEFFRICLV